jgi:hypothetical protein
MNPATVKLSVRSALKKATSPVTQLVTTIILRTLYGSSNHGPLLQTWSLPTVSIRHRQRSPRTDLITTCGQRDLHGRSFQQIPHLGNSDQSPPPGRYETLLLVAVGTALAGGPPRTDPSVRNSRTGLLPQVLVAKRTSGKGCITRPGGSHRDTICRIRAQLTRVRWLRRRSALNQCRVT